MLLFRNFTAWWSNVFVFVLTSTTSRISIGFKDFSKFEGLFQGLRISSVFDMGTIQTAKVQRIFDITDFLVAYGRAEFY